MCGFAGIVRFDNQDNASQTICALEQHLIHRGPDDVGFLSWRPGESILVGDKKNLKPASVHFVHRRLMIQDLSPLGSQPMISDDGRYTLIFNGEIYNFLELQFYLQDKGYTFHSQSDTEVLLNAFRHWKLDVFKHLQGMYSFAILDTLKQNIILARDPLGIKPLYYHHSKEIFSFSSEIKPLFVLPWIKKEPNPQTLYETLVLGQCDNPRLSFYQDIYPVPPAHYMVVSLKHNKVSEPQRYWSIQNEQIDLSYEEAKFNIQELWDESIDLHARSQVPIGCALSGGIDSSIITSTLAKQQAQALPTFSYLASQSAQNEHKWINHMLKSCSLEPHWVKFEAERFMQTFNKVIQAQDQPFGSLSIMAQYLVYECAKSHNVKVLLNGQGADELFAGYYRYFKHRLQSLLKTKQYIKAFAFGFNASLRHQLFKPSQFLKISLQKKKDNLLAPQWLDTKWFVERGVILPQNLFGKRQSLKHELISSLTEHGLLSLLRYDDLNAMAHGVETRVPFLHLPLVEFVTKLPENYLISDNAHTKAILRDAFESNLPQAISQRKDKIGFVADEKDLPISQTTLDEWHEKLQGLEFTNKKLGAKSKNANQLLRHGPMFRLLCSSYFLN